MTDVIIPNHPKRARFPINVYKWRECSEPKAWGSLFKDADALRVCLFAYEAPLIVRAFEDGAEVWKDSCLELFIRPEQDARYLNFEVNPLGNMIIALGANRHDRISMLDIKPQLDLRVTISPASKLWGVKYSIPFRLLEKIYGCKVGPRFYCNLYKCGGADDHLGMWREVNTETPDFHQPDSFGSIIMAE